MRIDKHNRGMSLIHVAALICSATAGYSAACLLHGDNAQVTALTIVDSKGRKCISLKVGDDGEGKIVFTDPDTEQDRMIIGLQLFGGPEILMHDPLVSKQLPGSSLELSCGGSPGQPLIRMKAEASTNDAPAGMELTLKAGAEPSLTMREGTKSLDLASGLKKEQKQK